MKLVIQRVKSASVSIDGQVYNAIQQGLLLLVGVGPDDDQKDLDYAVRKVSQMRIFSDEEDKMNLSVKDIQGEILSISQFTLFADTKKGNRPAFTAVSYTHLQAWSPSTRRMATIKPISSLKKKAWIWSIWKNW